MGGGPQSDYSVCLRPLCWAGQGKDRTGRDASSTKTNLIYSFQMKIPKSTNVLFLDLYDLQRAGVTVDTRLIVDDGELSINW